MSAKTIRRATFAALTAGALFLGVASAAQAAGPDWKIAAAANTSVPPEGVLNFYVVVQNEGEITDGSQISFTVTPPPELAIESAVAYDGLLALDCSALVPGGSDPFTCTSNDFIPTLYGANLKIVAKARPGASGEPTIGFSIGGGGGAPSSTVEPTVISPTPPGFGIDAFDNQVAADPQGTPFTQAGGHPYAIETDIKLNTATNPAYGEDPPTNGDVFPIGAQKDLQVELPAGQLGNPTGLAKCTGEQLSGVLGVPACPAASQVGTIKVLFDGRPGIALRPLYNMVPPTGSPAQFGFILLGTIVILDVSVRSDGDYGLTIGPRNSPQPFAVAGAETIFWGDPSDPVHDAERLCPFTAEPGCSAPPAPPLLRNPTSCPPAGEGLPWSVRADTWEHPGQFATASMVTHKAPGFPYPPSQWGDPQGPDGCADVPVKGELSAQPTALDTTTPTGLNVHVAVPNAGLENADGIAASDIKAVKVELPEGVTVNPSQAEGLGACSEAQFESSELSFHPDPSKGCPSASKIGSVVVHTPLLEEELPGEVYVATPYENEFGTLLALYMVVQEPQRGIEVKLAGKVETDPRTGQVTATFDDLPQQPFSSFDFHFREGARAPLVTPQSCGTYTTVATFTPWSDPSRRLISRSDFQITHGIGGGPCPTGGLPPFKPGLIAGSLNNNAGSYSPFNVRLFRTDAEQEITHFSIKLPPGLIGKLAGIPFCPDAAIEAAKSRTGAAELAAPSCPAASQIGRTLVGAGVGSVLTYAPGKLYLAGSYHGSALSIVDITAAKVGPFDLGTVLVRDALKVDPETAEVFIDATGSDPIPHIIKGITTHLRDIRAYVDKPEFTLNPTNCDPTSTASTVLGSGLDFASLADDAPVTVTTRYQAANCANLGFKPKLSLSLLGGTKRGDNPRFKAVLHARPGDANIGEAQVTLPHSEFLDNEHIKTICTRVQFKEGAVPGEKCPAASIYGYAKAVTPLLDEPLQGPVFLRSSSHNLPDLVAALNSGKINIALDGRIDSVQGGRIRNTFEEVPDAPVSTFTLTMQGGRKGLLVNSTNLCKRPSRATASFTGQNGKLHEFNPVLKPQCGKKAKGKKKRAGRAKG